MLPLLEPLATQKSGSAMRVEPLPRRPKVLRAAALSCAVHAVALAAIWVGASRGAALPVLAPNGALAFVPGPEAEPTYVALTPANLLDPAVTPPPDPVPSPARLPEADSALADEHAAAFERGLVTAREPAAADSGAGAGRVLVPAWRRDRETLRSRLHDGASAYQPAHEAIAARAASPQEIRQERVTGEGDSSRRRRLRQTAPSPLPTSRAESALDEDAPTVESAERPMLARTSGTAATRTDGPLDVRQGQRAFDLPKEGPAADNVASRAASNESRPGLIDYTAVASPGPGASGRGAGKLPGQASTPVDGTAPTPNGHPDPNVAVDLAGAATAEREYARAFQEIRRRVERALRFPKRLALDLQQGEAVIQFRVETDGRLSGEVKLLKSAGFEEFDREAVDIVRRTAPFPPLSKPVVVRMPVTFENPLIR
jgi:TonB family protein